MITLNCDIGERGPDHPIDVALMDQIQMANIACGGHAGDVDSVRSFRKLAEKNRIDLSAHLSYPDPENFGRYSMDISTRELQSALDRQIRLLPDVQCVKFHGALYNDAVLNPDLASVLTDWLLKHNMKKIITSDGSELADSCLLAGMTVLYEAFAERRYTLDPQSGRLTLVSRTRDYASITNCDEALDHSRMIIQSGHVLAYVEHQSGEPEQQLVKLKAQTLCIHSDSKIALQLATKLNTLIRSLEGQQAGLHD